MTGLTFRQDVFVFYLSGTIDVKCLMALHTVYPMLATLGSYKLVKVRMTAPTLLGLHGLNPRCIHGWKVWLCSPLRRRWCYTPTKS
jgi:hypothetical protein